MQRVGGLRARSDSLFAAADGSLGSHLTAYGPKLRSAVRFERPSRTLQQFAEECDVNTIMSRFQATGLLPSEPREGQFLDCTGFDFQAASDFVASARSQFFGLPARVRDRFDNDPAAFLDGVTDPRIRSELVEMGVLIPSPPETISTAPSATASVLGGGSNSEPAPGS